MEDSRLKQIRDLCEQSGITRFSAEEIAELVEDGEDTDWIIDQVRSEGASEVISRLEQLLQEIAVPVGGEGEGEGEDAIDSEASVPGAGGAKPDTTDLAQVMEGLELPPGIDRSQFEQLMASPRAALIADFGLFCQEKGVDPEQPQGNEASTDGALQELQDEWLETPREGLEGKMPKDLLDGGRLFPGGRVETYRREEPKVGRNDLCPCGSGKKFKKCCGKQ